MVKILAALSILNSSGASPGATEKVAALVTALNIFMLDIAAPVASTVTTLTLHQYCFNSMRND